MTSSDGDILDRLYTDEGASLSTRWLWDNLSKLNDRMVPAIGAACYVAVHTANRMKLAQESGTVDEATEELEDLVGALAEQHGYVLGSDVAGISPAMLQILLIIAKRLIDRYLDSLDE